MNSPSTLAFAIDEWSKALGPEGILSSDDALDRYGRTTQHAGTRPACILYPQKTKDVQAIVETAARHGVVVYPISKGNNWGYGDACAPSDGAAIVDLGRMNRILEVDTDFAYAVIEPGVTQQQLYDHLQQNNTGLRFDATGAGLDASLVGNTLERGFGHTRYGDHTATVSGMEIVLPDGRILNTGFGHYEGAKAAPLYPYGVGPDLAGLFYQSNYGIVTKLTVWLMPQPEAFTSYFIPLESDVDLSRLLTGLRRLRLDGVINSAVHIGNDLRLLSAAGRYPWEEAGGVTPLPEDLREKMRKENGYGRWNVAGSLTGTAGHVRESRRALKKVLGGIARLIFMSDAKVALAEKILPPLNAVGIGKRWMEQLKTLKPNHGLLKGIPTNEPLRGTQWRLRKPPEDDTPNPLDAGCGLYWISPILPVHGEDALAFMKMVEPIFDAHGFEALVTFTLVTDRAMVAILNVVFDKADPEESRKAQACYNETVQVISAAGYIPYRSGLQGMDRLRDPDDVFWQVASQIKATLDPKDILARGRYIPPLSK